MLFVLSGEGSTDLGGHVLEEVTGQRFEPGPLAYAIEQLIAKAYDGHSILATNTVVYKSEGDLGEFRGKRSNPRSMRIPGLGSARQKGDGLHEQGAFELAQIAQQLAIEEKDDKVVVIFFRDTDGTHSSRPDLWEAHVAAMHKGFEKASFRRGVPMVPKPQSEAWLLCALQARPYRSCEKLEQAPGNDASPKSLKLQLEKYLGAKATRTNLVERVHAGEIDFLKIGMPSFEAFKQALARAIDRADLLEGAWRVES